MIFDWVERRDGKVTIDKKNGASLASTFSSFKSKIENENRNRFFVRNLGYFALGALMTVLAVVLVIIFGDLTEGEIGLLIAGGFVGFFLGVFVVPLIRALSGARGVKSMISTIFTLAIVLVFGVIFISDFFSGTDVLPDDFGRNAFRSLWSNSFPFVLVGGFALLNGVFYYLLRAPTAAGRTVMDQIEGLELYIRTAETNRLNLAGAPDLTTEQFERLLPYAIALNAEEPWSEAFQSAFARANPGEQFERWLPAGLARESRLVWQRLRQLDGVGGERRRGLVSELGSGAEILVVRLLRRRWRGWLGWRRRRWWGRRLVAAAHGVSSGRDTWRSP